MDSAKTTLTLIGGPTVLIEFDGLRLLTDPTFDPPGDYQGGVLLKKTAGPAPWSRLSKCWSWLSNTASTEPTCSADSGRAFLERANTTFTTGVGASRLRGSRSAAVRDGDDRGRERRETVGDRGACPARPSRD